MEVLLDDASGYADVFGVGPIQEFQILTKVPSFLVTKEAVSTGCRIGRDDSVSYLKSPHLRAHLSDSSCQFVPKRGGNILYEEGMPLPKELKVSPTSKGCADLDQYLVGPNRGDVDLLNPHLFGAIPERCLHLHKQAGFLDLLLLIVNSFAYCLVAIGGLC